VSARPPFEHASRYPVNRGFSIGVFSVLMLFAASLVWAAWVSMGIVTKERWPIRWLELRGSFDRVSAEQLRGSLSPLVNSSFFTLDLRRLKNAAERNAWVAAVDVQKEWPDTVTVTIEEHVPVAHWNSSQLISNRGKAFAAAGAGEIQGLPWLYGPDEQVDLVLEYWLRFNSMLDSAALEIEQLTLDRRGAWSLQLNNGTRLSLGREDVTGRLERLIKSWDTLRFEQDRPPALVDLRYTNGFAVRWPKDKDQFAGIASPHVAQGRSE